MDPVNPNVVWSGGIDLFRSDDSGQTWGTASYWWFTPGVDPEYAHADQHAIVFHPQYNGTTNQVMFFGNDGGIFTTSNAKAQVSYSPAPITNASPICGNTSTQRTSFHFTALNNGYELTQFYDGVIYPNNTTFFGGTQDNSNTYG